MKTLTFQNTTLTPIKTDNQIWLSSSDLAKALGYSQENAVTKIYSRNADEFTPNMTQVVDITETVKLTTPKNHQNLVKKVRIFSLRGCHLIAMFARTKVAKEFRKWVLDILDKEVGEPVQVNPRTIKINDTQAHQIQKAIKQKCLHNRLHYQTLYHAIYNAFGVKSYKDILASDFDEVMSFIQEFSFDEKQPFFLHKQAAHEFDVRLRHIFDLASLMKDNPTANLIKRRAEELNRFLVNYQNKYLL